MNVKIRTKKPDNAEQQSLFMPPFDLDVFTGKTIIRVILQSEKVKYELGMGHELISEPMLGKFPVELEYQDVEGNPYSSSHEIDVSEVVGRSASTPSTTKIWRELEKIQKKIK